MSAEALEALLQELEARDIKLSAHGGKLRCDAPRGALTPALRSQLAAHKAELLDHLGQRDATMSSSQARNYALMRVCPQLAAASNVPLGFRLRGALDPPALERALASLVTRHEVFRSRCVPGPRVELLADPSFSLQHEDLRDDPEQLTARTRALIDAPFELERAPLLLRATLLQLGDADWQLVLVTHVLAFDGRSTPLLIAELSASYAAARRGSTPSLPPAPRYAEVTRRMRAQLEPTQLERQRAWWRESLAGSAPLGPWSQPRASSELELRCGHVELRVSSAIAASLARLARRCRASLFHTLLAAWFALLQRHVGRTQLSVGTVVSNRRGPEAEQTIGSFANNLLLSAQLDPELSFRALVEQLRDHARRALSSPDLAFEELVAELEPAWRREPAFRVMFALHQLGRGETVELALPEVEVETLELHKSRSPYDLELTLTELDGVIHGTLVHNLVQLPTPLAEAIAARYLELLERVCAEPELRLGALPEHALEPLDPVRPPPAPEHPPRGPTERAIAALWSELLGHQAIGRSCSFFALGGHSLLALTMLAQLRAHYGTRVHAEALERFAARPTVAALAELIEEHGAA